MMAISKKIKLGYYLQAPFQMTPDGPRVPIEVKVWSEYFTGLCDRFVCFMHSSPSFPASNERLAEGTELVDLGPLISHWRRTLGLDVPSSIFREHAPGLDAIIIQGPTSMLPHVARVIQPALPVFYLVGFWTHRRPNTFKTYGQFKELGLRLMRAYSEWDHRRVFPLGVISGNNTLMGERYEHLAPFQLISHASVGREEIRARTSQTLHNPVRLLSLGRVDPDKHLETLLKACVLLRDKLNFVLDIVGGGWPGYVEHLQCMVYDLGLEEHVTLHGMVRFEETTNFYNKADVFIFHTSGTEGFPRVIWEAFAKGVPVIAAEYPGASGLLTDQHDVLLFPRRDTEALVDRVFEVVQDETLRTKLATNGVNLLRKHTPDISCRQLITMIEQAVADRNHN